ncbi:zinc finger protein [Saccharopolyspora mangrovi]|uniref:Zinc finger protein n=1 Tax=Saccharopolyspora mangrovi TaxID=3082379 RepID=A0ABU6ABJ1_9PSEU|nr:zinc finger protein [Saccharopolyspora sp. S2-29]MEB3368904.1 zinc finger protein [Saccharopolyspora sp. S2-29]
MSYRPHPFTWCPSEAARRATAQMAPRDGEQFETLCGKLGTADRSDVAWFWPTCPECDRRAHEIAGIPMPPAESTPTSPREFGRDHTSAAPARAKAPKSGNCSVKPAPLSSSAALEDVGEGDCAVEEFGADSAEDVFGEVGAVGVGVEA